MENFKPKSVETREIINVKVGGYLPKRGEGKRLQCDDCLYKTQPKRTSKITNEIHKRVLNINWLFKIEQWWLKCDRCWINNTSNDCESKKLNKKITHTHTHTHTHRDRQTDRLTCTHTRQWAVKQEKNAAFVNGTRLNSSRFGRLILKERADDVCYAVNAEISLETISTTNKSYLLVDGLC